MTRRAAPPLRASAAWALAGNASFAGGQWAILSATAWLGGSEAVGTYALALAIATPTSILCNAGLRQVAVTDARRDHEPGTYLRARLMGTAAATLILIIASSIILPAPAAGVLAVVSVVKAMDSGSDLIYGLWQRDELFVYVARSQILRSVAGALAFSVVYWWTRALTAALLSLALSWALLLLVHDLRGSRHLLEPQPLETPRDSESIYKILRLGFPLGLAATTIALQSMVPRYFLKSAAGSAALGIYAGLAFFATSGMMVVSALGQAVSPRLSQYAANLQPKLFLGVFLRLQLLFAATGVVAAGAAAIIGEEVVITAYGPDYAGHGTTLAWFMIAATLSYLGAASGFAMTALHMYREQIAVQAAALVATATSSAAIIPAYGLWGAIISFGVAQLAYVVGGCGFTLRRIHHLQPNDEPETKTSAP